jgi:hypothetical protein
MPQGVVNVIKIKASTLPTKDDILRLLSYSPSYLWTGKRWDAKTVGDLDFLPIPNDACNPPDLLLFPYSVWRAIRGNQDGLIVIIGAIIGSAVFGGIHCIAWNFTSRR